MILNFGSCRGYDLLIQRSKHLIEQVAKPKTKQVQIDITSHT